MTWYQINYFLGSVLSLLAGLFVLFRGESKRSIQYTWFLLCLSTSIWFAGRFLMSVADAERLAEKAIYVVYVGAVFSPVFFLHFAMSLLGQEKQRRRLQSFFYSLTVIWITVLIGGNLTTGVHRLPNLGFYEKPTHIYLGF